MNPHKKEMQQLQKGIKWKGQMPKGKFERAKIYPKAQHNPFVPKKVKPPLGFCRFCWKPCDKEKDVCKTCYGERMR